MNDSAPGLFKKIVLYKLWFLVSHLDWITEREEIHDAKLLPYVEQEERREIRDNVRASKVPGVGAFRKVATEVFLFLMNSISYGIYSPESME
jgi:hypothetical protein